MKQIAIRTVHASNQIYATILKAASGRTGQVITSPAVQKHPLERVGLPGALENDCIRLTRASRTPPCSPSGLLGTIIREISNPRP